jgi:hypothetical protein
MNIWRYSNGEIMDSLSTAKSIIELLTITIGLITAIIGLIAYLKKEGK